ncbi:MAG: site-2 protease family protein [Faecousia sp.]
MPRIKISPWLPVGLCILYRIDPLGCFWPFLVAAGFHELGHILFLYLSGARVQALAFSLTGAAIETSPLSYRQEMLCALAGPFFGLLLLAVGKRFPWLAFWGFIQSMFNLLPIYPLDGGRFLRAVLAMRLPLHRAERICKTAAGIIVACLCCLSLYVCKFLGLMPILAAAFLLFRFLRGSTGSP